LLTLYEIEIKRYYLFSPKQNWGIDIADDVDEDGWMMMLFSSLLSICRDV
jgi:hypothetical protein